MKISLLSLLAVLFSLSSQAALRGSPFGPATDARFDAIESSTNSGLGLQRLARATYDFAVQGGSSTATVKSLGVTLPANAIITRSYIYTLTQVAGASSLVALQCETANNIFSSADMTGITAGTITEGVSTGAASVFQKITAACNISAKITAAAVTAGKFDVFVQYVVHE